jgi:hypothetical protein
MNSPLEPGKKYKLNADGEFVEVPSIPDNAVPVPDEDLPPDMRSEAKSTVEKLTEAVDKISKLVDSKSTAETKPVENKPAETKYDISDEDKAAFLKSVISNTPYRKTFTAFNGAVKMVFKTLSTSELDAISEALAIQSARVPYSSMLALAGAHMRFAMASSLVELQFESEEGVTVKGFPSVNKMYGDESRKDSFFVRDKDGIMQKKEAALIATPGQKVLWAAMDKFSDISVPMYNLLFEKYQRFDAEVLQLTKEASNPDFFQNGADGLS